MEIDGHFLSGEFHILWQITQILLNLLVKDNLNLCIYVFTEEKRLFFCENGLICVFE